METEYWTGSAIVGIVIVLDAVLLYRGKGKPNPLVFITSTVELLWFAVSIVALWTRTVTMPEALAPIGFVAYYLAGLIFWGARSGSIGDIGGLVMPRWAALLALLVGMSFSAAALWALFSL